MNQDEGHIVTLRHSKQGGYLRGTTEQISRETKIFFIFPSRYQETDRFYVVLDNQPDQWILRPKHKQSTQLRYGDEFTIQHKSSRRYLNSFIAEKSETTEQGLMCLTNSESWFFMQTCQHIRYCYSIINQIQTLHSHYNKYKFYKVSNYREVTSFKERDDNDFWQISLETPIHMDIDYKLIKSGDKVLIKNIHDLEYMQLVGNTIELVKGNHHGNMKKLNYIGARSMIMQLVFDNFDQTYIYIVPTKQYIDIDENEVVRLQSAKIRPFQIIPIKSKEFLLGQYFYIQIHDRYLSRGNNQKLSLNQFPNVLSIWSIEQKE
ncbi:hypothetical protein pb186bvf_017738 [Paramecium bursaria]